jgi:hypothetical protein
MVQHCVYHCAYWPWYMAARVSTPVLPLKETHLETGTKRMFGIGL